MLYRGMLWVDDTDGRSLDLKVERAASYFQSKYGAKPDVCYVHPTALADETPSLRSIKVLGAKTILPHHFWLGVSAPETRDSPGPPQVRQI